MQIENPIVAKPIVEPKPIFKDVFGDEVYEGVYIYKFPDGEIVLSLNLTRYLDRYLNAKRTEIWSVNDWFEGVVEDGWIFDDFVVSDDHLELFIEKEYGAELKRAGEE